MKYPHITILIIILLTCSCSFEADYEHGKTVTTVNDNDNSVIEQKLNEITQALEKQVNQINISTPTVVKYSDAKIMIEYWKIYQDYDKQAVYLKELLERYKKNKNIKKQ